MPDREEISIQLPPRGSKRRQRNGSRWPLIAITAIILITGIAVGSYLGVKYSQKSEPPTIAQPAIISVADPTDQLLSEAREAMTSDQLTKARDLYQQVLSHTPNHGEATASLALIKRHLKTVAQAKTVTAEKPKPAEPKPDAEQNNAVGQLELASKPVGAKFKIIKTEGDKQEPIELVEVGKTPAKIEQLDAGDYQVLMEIDGYPAYSKNIKLETNRSASVSAVFASGGVNITSDPAGAEVWVSSKMGKLRKRGETPLSLDELALGEHQMELRYKDWPTIRRTVAIEGSQTQNLEFTWKRSLVTFTSDPPGAEVYHDMKRLGGTDITPFTVELPEGDYLFRARHRLLGELNQGSYIDELETDTVDFNFAYGSVVLKSTPTGAAIIHNGLPIGRTPLTQTVVAPGEHEWELRLLDHKTARLSGIVESGGELAFSSQLKYNKVPTASKDFTNSAGIKFLWIAQLGGWVSETEVAQAPYQMMTGANPSHF
ncbi:MAG: PEGA domain-containing protein, partial [Verrucomicrobiota bacterium]